MFFIIKQGNKKYELFKKGLLQIYFPYICYLCHSPILRKILFTLWYFNHDNPSYMPFLNFQFVFWDATLIYFDSAFLFILILSLQMSSSWSFCISLDMQECSLFCWSKKSILWRVVSLETQIGHIREEQAWAQLITWLWGLAKDGDVSRNGPHTLRRAFSFRIPSK